MFLRCNCKRSRNFHSAFTGKFYPFFSTMKVFCSVYFFVRALNVDFIRVHSNRTVQIRFVP